MNTRELPHDEQPDPRFAQHLEWELERALRREARFARPTRGAEAAPSRRTSALLALGFAAALALGGGGAWAAQNVLRSRGAQALIAQQSMRVELAALHERRARADLERAELQHSAGMVSATQLLASRADLSRAVEQLELEQLDQAEVQATASAPQRALSAPRVDSRDLVSERLAAQRRSLEAQFEAARQTAEHSQVRFESGMATQIVAAADRRAADALQRQIELVEARLALRARSIAGELGAVEVERLDLYAQTRARCEQAELEVRQAQEELDHSEALHGAGILSQRELDAAAHALEVRRLAWQHALADLAWLEQK